MLAPSDCPQDIQVGSLPKHATHASLFSTRLLVADASVWATFPLGVGLGTYSVFFFFLSVMLPSEISKLPTDPRVRGFLGVWKLLLLHDSLPGMVSIPNSFVSLCFLYFLLPPFKENKLPFWVPGILCQYSEVLLWRLLSIQIIFLMNFWGIKWSPCPIPPPS